MRLVADTTELHNLRNHVRDLCIIEELVFDASECFAMMMLEKHKEKLEGLQWPDIWTEAGQCLRESMTHCNESAEERAVLRSQMLSRVYEIAKKRGERS